MERIVSRIWTILFLSAFLLLICFPQAASAAVAQGLQLCVQTVIPALFPYMVLSSLFLVSGVSVPTRISRLTETLFHLPGSCSSVILLGFLGGYPMGAKCAAELKQAGRIREKDAAHLLLFCNNAGPSFFFGVIGTALLHSAAAGALLYGIHVLTALGIGILFRNPERPIHSSDSVPHPADAQQLVTAIRSSGQTALSVCTFLVFFFVLSAPVRIAAKPGSFLSALLCAILELTGGCAEIASSALPWSVRFALLSGALGWGGFCVHLQTAGVIAPAGLRMQKYLPVKLLHSLFSALLALPCAALVPGVQQAALTDLPFRTEGYLSAAFFLPLLIFIFFPTGNCRKKPV